MNGLHNNVLLAEAPGDIGRAAAQRFSFHV